MNLEPTFGLADDLVTHSAQEIAAVYLLLVVLTVFVTAVLRYLGKM